MQDQVRQIMADVLNLDFRAIDGSTSRESTASWNSLNHISLVLAIEQQFGILLDPKDIESMSSFGSILRVLETKLKS